MRRSLSILGCLLLAMRPSPAGAYITAPVQTLGGLCGSTYITLVRIEKVSKEKGVIIYQKVKDLKGQYPRDRIRHAFDLKNTPLHKGLGDVPVRPDEKDWRYVMDWAEVGKTAVVFSLKYDPYGDFGHTYIDKCWYATMCPARDWDFWWAIYSDPALLTRWHCGTPAHLGGVVEQVLAGKTAVVPSLAGGSRDELRAGRGKLQGIKVSLQIGDFNADRDRVPNWSPREIPALIKELDHADPQVRLQALTDLSSAGPDAKAAVARLEALLQDKDDDTRLAALTALVSIDPGNPRIAPAAMAFLKHESPEKRIRAAELALQAGAAAPETAAAASALLEGTAKEVRLRACSLLSRLGPAAKAAVPALARMLQDPERDVRIQAAETLGAIGPEATGAVAALAETVGRDGSGTVRMRSADALARIGAEAKSARPVLEAALKDPAMARRPEVLAKIRETLDRLK